MTRSLLPRCVTHDVVTAARVTHDMVTDAKVTIIILCTNSSFPCSDVSCTSRLSPESSVGSLERTLKELCHRWEPPEENPRTTHTGVGQDTGGGADTDISQNTGADTNTSQDTGGADTNASQDTGGAGTCAGATSDGAGNIEGGTASARSEESDGAYESATDDSGTDVYQPTVDMLDGACVSKSHRKHGKRRRKKKPDGTSLEELGGDDAPVQNLSGYVIAGDISHSQPYPASPGVPVPDPASFGVPGRDPASSGVPGRDLPYPALHEVTAATQQAGSTMLPHDRSRHPSSSSESSAAALLQVTAP